MAISDYSSTPGNNSAISGINIAEGCAPANVNNAIRQVMADLATAIGPLTASAAELNTLDGITASTSELNILDGVTASAAELNTLDGITASTAELNQLDGLVPEPKSTASAGIGQIQYVNPAAGAGYALPAGSSNWEYFLLRLNVGVVASAAAGVAVGGTVVGASAGGQNWIGFIKRLD